MNDLGELWNYIKFEEYSLVYEGGKKKTLMTSQEKYLLEYHVTFVCSIMVSEGRSEIVLMVNLLHTFLGAWAWGILLKRVLWSLKLWGTWASPRQGLQSESTSSENQNRCGGGGGSQMFQVCVNSPKEGSRQHITPSVKIAASPLKTYPKAFFVSSLECSGAAVECLGLESWLPFSHFWSFSLNLPELVSSFAKRKWSTVAVRTHQVTCIGTGLDSWMADTVIIVVMILYQLGFISVS